MKTTQTVKNTYGYIGCDYYSTNVNHLVISQAESVTADSYGDTYNEGNQIIIIARDSGTNDVYGYLALATGEVVGSASDFWPEYHHPESPANGLVSVSKIVKIPAELLGRLGQRGICEANRQQVANYILRNGQ